jgi:curved DNA-binding protein CbpA
MAARGGDPYRTLGINPGASDDELRAAYRRLVQLHHPDHNGGSAESARRFEEVQEAYAQIRRLRDATAGTGSSPRAGSASPRARGPSSRAGGAPPPRETDDPGVESRIAELERELREAQVARERARRAAREAAAETAARPSDEELGYVTTDDSFSKILADARSELSQRFSDAREHPAVRRAGDLIDELDELAVKLGRKPPPRSR